MAQMLGTLIVAALLLLPTSAAAQFEYDSKQSFDTVCEQLTPRHDADVHGCHFTGPRGGTLSFILVNPKTAKPPFAGVIFQHGGGQSMWNYLSDALILAQLGVVSLIPDAPARGEGKKSEINTMKLREAEDFQAEIVITERRVLDFLLRQPGVDSKRIAYVGHRPTHRPLSRRSLDLIGGERHFQLLNNQFEVEGRGVYGQWFVRHGEIPS